MCPACRRDAPVLMRGLKPTCALCGAMRAPAEAARAVNLAGQPARVGGRVSRALGFTVAICGTLLAVLLGGGAQLLFPDSPIGLLLGVPIFILSSALAIALLLGGRRLTRSGDERAHAGKLEAIRALARTKGGELEVEDVTKALRLSAADADALLTELAKTPDARVDLDVDDDGRLRYRFADPGVRVAVGMPRAAADGDAEALEADAARGRPRTPAISLRFDRAVDGPRARDACCRSTWPMLLQTGTFRSASRALGSQRAFLDPELEPP